MPKLSIIIPCFHEHINHASLTRRCLSSIESATKIPYELCLVENLNRWVNDSGNIYVHFSEPRTYAQNVNTGLKIATGDYLCVMNNDVLVCDDWIETILKCFEIDDCGIATIDSNQYQRRPEDKIYEDFWGALWVIKRSVMEKVGLLDETFVHAFDDADYWVRTYLAGYKIYMNRSQKVTHGDGSTIHNFNNHHQQYLAMRKQFNEKHDGCTLPIFERLR